MMHPPTWRPTRYVQSRHHHGQRRSYRPTIVALEDRVVPAPINATFTLDSTNSTLSLSGSYSHSSCNTGSITAQGTGALTTSYSGTLVAQFDFGASSFQLQSGGTVTAANSGTWQPAAGGANGSAPANYGAHVHLSCSLGTSVDINAAIRNLVNTVTSGVVGLSGSGGTYHFAGNVETLHFNSGTADYRYSGVTSGSGSSNFAGDNSTNNAAQGTLQDIGGGNFRLTIPISGTTTSGAGGGTLILTSSGMLVANVNLSFGVAGLANPDTAGTSQSVTVTAKAGSGTNTAYRGTVHFASNDPQVAGLPSNYTFTAADNGVHTFTGIVLETAGSRTITVTDASDSNIVGSQTVTVNPAAASSLTASGFPSPITAGTAGNITVTAKDAYGNVATGYTGTVHFSSSDPQASLPNNSTLTNGTGTFSATLKTAGAQGITATDTVNGSLTGTQSGITVNPAAASALLVNGFPSSIVAGTPGNVTVTAKDPYGNTATGYAGTVHFTSSDGQAALPADSTLTNGTGTFAATLKTAGSQSITATDTVNNSVTGSQSGISVSPAALDHLSVTTSADATGTVAGTAFEVTVTAQDAYNNTVTTYTGTVTFTSGDPYGAILPPDYTFQPSDMGQVTLPAGATLFTAGAYDVTATDTGNPALTASDFVNVVAAPATSLLVIAPTDVTSGAPFDLTVEALDPYGNIDTNYGGTVTFSTTDPDPGAVLPLDYTFQPGIDNGVVTLTDTGRGETTLVTLGLQTITVTDTVDGTITGSADVMVDPAANVPGGLNREIASATPASSSSASSRVLSAVTGAASTASQPITSAAQPAAAPMTLPHAVDSFFAAFPDVLSLDGSLGNKAWTRNL